MAELKFEKPVKEEKRFKAIIEGPYGSGKTPAALQFIKAAIIDTEKGTDQYSDLINEKGSKVIQTTDFEEAKEQILALLQNKHDFLTLIIDPETHLYASCIEKWKKIFNKYETKEKNKDLEDFGFRFWGKVNSDFKSLQRLYLQLDMNVIVITHPKAQMDNGVYTGTSYDTIKNAAHLFDFCFKIEKRNGKPWAIVDRERAFLGQAKFPLEFEWSYENFVKYLGKETLERKSVPIQFASDEDVNKINDLIKSLKVSFAGLSQNPTDITSQIEELDKTISEWLMKADVETFKEMTKEKVDKCIKVLEKKLKEINTNAKS